jgi:hypothetical protein
VRTIADLFKDDETRRGPDAAVKLAQAYKDVFGGHGSKEQSDVVLVDILRVTGYYHVTPIGTSSEVLHEVEGGRRVGAHILERLSIDIATLREAQSAVGRESRVDAKKGEL